MEACLIAVAFGALTSCAQTPPAPTDAAPSRDRPACHKGADAKGIASSFFAFFQDDPSCF